MRTSEAAKGKWFGILSNLGIDQNFLRNVHGPCPVCGGEDRYRWDDKNGDGTYYCSNCGAGDGFKLAMDYTGLNFKEMAKKIDSMVGNIQALPVKVTKKDPRFLLNKIKGELESIIQVGAVRNYLSARNLPMSEYLSAHRGLRYYEKGVYVKSFAAKVALLTDPSGKPITYHITYLNADGSKASVSAAKKIMTPVNSLDGACVRLSNILPHIGIAEGIETALAVKKLFGVDCWASCNANLLEKFEAPHGVGQVTIFADKDSSFTGQASAYVLAKKLKRKGLKVSVKFPPNTDQDFADMVTS